MLRIAEKLEFMIGRVVKVDTKIEILSSQASKNLLFCQKNAEKRPQKREILTVQANFCQIIRLDRRKLCFVNV